MRIARLSLPENTKKELRVRSFQPVVGKRLFARGISTLLGPLLIISCAYVPLPPPWGPGPASGVSPGPLTMDDVGRLYPTQVKEVVHAREVADWRIVQASRTENRELFSLAIGGYGLFGVILDVDLSLTDNDVYEKKTVELDYADYLDFFKREIRGNPNVGLHYAWPSVASEGFLKTMLVSTYYKTDQRPEGIFNLTTESYIPITRFFLSLSRQGRWGKDFRWSMQKRFADRPGSTKTISRNNAM